MNIKWKFPDDNYLNYLRENYEKRIPFSDYGDDKHKPFFGSLFEVGDIIYISQVSHAQKGKHDNMKQQLDFYKIYHPDDNRLIAVINLNYMFPIHKSLLTNLEYKDIDKYRNLKLSNNQLDIIDNAVLKLIYNKTYIKESFSNYYY